MAVQPQMSKATHDSLALETERKKLYDNVTKKLDYIIKKKKEGKYKHQKEGLNEPFLSRSYNSLLSTNYESTEASSESEDPEVMSLGKKLSKMDSPSSSPRRKEENIIRKKTRDVSVQVDVPSTYSRDLPPLSD